MSVQCAMCQCAISSLLGLYTLLSACVMHTVLVYNQPCAFLSCSVLHVACVFHRFVWVHMDNVGTSFTFLKLLKVMH